MLKQYFRNSPLIAIPFMLMAALPVWAETHEKSPEPIVITSNKMVADKLADKVRFMGNVVLKKEGMTLNADSMVVFYDPGSKNIHDIKATGNVVVRRENRVALSDNASYFSREEKIVLTGNARIIENENQIDGETITLFMRDDRSIVEGGKVLLYQDKQERPLDGSRRK